jgi:hypothetical protein
MKRASPISLTITIAMAGLAGMLCVAPKIARAWGNEGHMWINLVAARHVPSEMPGFLRGAEGRLAYLGPEPDRWRSPTEPFLKNAQEPDHFIDLELVEGMDLPVGRYPFLKLLEQRRLQGGANAAELEPDKVGLQPYITMEVYGRLKAALREWRKLKTANQKTEAVEQNAVFYAGWLGHYVGDGSQPLHTTIYYNGWVGANPNGYTTKNDIHWKFESEFVAKNLNPKSFSSQVGAPSRLQDPFHDYLRYLKESNALVAKVYELEKAGALDGAGNAESRQFTAQRLAAASQMLLNLWYTAWLESAEPLPPAPAPRAAAKSAK